MTETTTRTLTADDVKALRTADGVSFHYSPNPDRASEIVCRKTVRNAGPFGERERKHEIRVGAEFRGTHTGGAPVGPETAACFETIMSAQFDELWLTVAGLVKTGDELYLRWEADHYASGYVNNARIIPGQLCAGEALHADGLTLVIRRGEKRLVFLLDVSICPNNSARMIRYAR